MVKASAYNVGDPGSIPGLGRSPGERNGNPLQYSCLENPMDGEAQQATIHGVTKNRTQLSDFTFTYSRYQSILRHKLYKNFFPVYSLSFHLLTSLCKVNFFHFDKPELTFPFRIMLLMSSLRTPCLLLCLKEFLHFFPLKILLLYILYFMVIYFEFGFFCLFVFLNKARGLVSG